MGTRGQQPPAMGRAALAGCWPGGATKIVSVLKCWEGREQAVTQFSLWQPRAFFFFAGLVGRLWLCLQDGLPERITDEE